MASIAIILLRGQLLPYGRSKVLMWLSTRGLVFCQRFCTSDGVEGRVPPLTGSNILDAPATAHVCIAGSGPIRQPRQRAKSLTSSRTPTIKGVRLVTTVRDGVSSKQTATGIGWLNQNFIDTFLSCTSSIEAS
jgi:hypothetical protein